MKRFVLGVLAAAAMVLPAAAQVKVGVIVSATGPGASVGVTQQRTVPILPKTLGGKSVDYILLDDASDTSTAVKHAQKLITKDKVDVIVGPSLTPNSLALLELVIEQKVPMISLAGSALIVEPVDEKRRWVFKTPQSDAQMASVVLEHMGKSGIKTLAFIGFSDAYGEGWIKVMTGLAEANGIEVVASERFQRTDSSVTGQILKIVARKPDAVFIAASGTPAALPQRTLVERGYKGTIYQTHGVANNDFLRVGGKALEGTFVPAGPVLVAEQLPDDHPAKAPALDFIKLYEAIPGAGARSTFAAYLWDAQLILDAAIRKASEKAEPGTPEFRAALRDAVESTRDVAGPNGVYNMSPTDHLGLDERSRVMTQIVDGKWTLVD
ncbi:ABC transporter substrate-binding protein [Rhodoligotrophos defluvii]|uniref:ABC transporter substrate-binding protein n=1 Tax=Rhodoligotrophos defluvii TaxID=2561934 RepID=UPI001EF0E537|nr:ABC transporter substrate-binding protein [Rhodoligotrophos defluvii]